MDDMMTTMYLRSWRKLIVIGRFQLKGDHKILMQHVGKNLGRMMMIPDIPLEYMDLTFSGYSYIEVNNEILMWFDTPQPWKTNETEQPIP